MGAHNFKLPQALGTDIASFSGKTAAVIPPFFLLQTMFVCHECCLVGHDVSTERENQCMLRLMITEMELSEQCSNRQICSFRNHSAFLIVGEVQCMPRSLPLASTSLLLYSSSRREQNNRCPPASSRKADKLNSDKENSTTQKTEKQKTECNL